MVSRLEIAPKAFEMFRDFTKNVKQVYPDINLTIIDETLLVNDLVETVTKARVSLMHDEKKNKREIQGYDLGFMIGFITANLSTRWEYEYIMRQSDGYKQFCCFKAIRLYLELSSLTALRVGEIYNHLITEGVNVENINKIVVAEDLDRMLANLEDEIKPHNAVLQALHNYENNYINQYLKRKTGRFLDSSKYYFTDQELTDIIDNGVEDV
jgi:hypothetical protein